MDVINAIVSTVSAYTPSSLSSMTILAVFYGVGLLVMIEILYVITAHASWSRLSKLLVIIIVLIIFLTPVWLMYQRTYAPAFFSGVTEQLVPSETTDTAAVTPIPIIPTISLTTLSITPPPAATDSALVATQSGTNPIGSKTPTLPPLGGTTIVSTISPTPTARVVAVIPKMPEAGVVEITIAMLIGSLIVLGLGLVI